ncbi:hypothetical protein DID80_07620 [Candidatus Marinamargulisbacteria bacterium SCGC AAA071-K20]|nr:hypothetical protein DID80_07620 [Candidatus Marinamargulisbacteria bacterium SCGC AAA071-K20]
MTQFTPGLGPRKKYPNLSKPAVDAGRCLPARTSDTGNAAASEPIAPPLNISELNVTLMGMKDADTWQYLNFSSKELPVVKRCRAGDKFTKVEICDNFTFK